MYIIALRQVKTPKNHFRYSAMLRLEQITALILAAGLAIPSYWFFWTLAGGGGYERRETENVPKLEKMILKNPSQWILTHNRWK